jgi:cyclopropane fatty-acyl-phospholipid synthase-like methyltransferase
VVFLAEHGFDVTGLDFSAGALAKAEQAAAASSASDRIRLVKGDLTASSIPRAEGPFDLLISYGTLEDFWPAKRQPMADTIKRLTRPGGVFLCWCFYASREELPWFSLGRPSRLVPLTLFPGEEEVLFGDDFDIERHPVRSPRPAPKAGAACFLMTRRESTD